MGENDRDWRKCQGAVTALKKCNAAQAANARADASNNAATAAPSGAVPNSAGNKQ